MDPLSRLFRRLRYLFRREELDAAMDEEIRFHIEMETRKNIREGMSPREARRAAMVAFGGVERHKEATREARGTLLVESTVQDVGLALRDMRRSPAFALTAVASLALGLTATALVFGAMDAVAFRDLPVPAPERLVSYDEDRSGPGTHTQSGHVSVEYRRYRSLAAQAREVADLAGYTYDDFALGSGTVVRGIMGNLVSRNYFRALQLRPAAGRFFDPSLEGPGAPAEVVIAHHLWQTEFEGDPAVVGRTLQLDGKAHRVVGVAPEAFHGILVALGTDVWVPADLDVYGPDETSRRNLVVFGRLEPGVPAAAAQSALGDLARQTPPDSEDAEIRGVRLTPLTPLPEAFEGAAVGFVGILVIMAVLVLTVAAANVGGMLLARSARRAREIAVRMALGGQRARLVRSFVTETLVVFVAAGAVGLVVATLLSRLVEAYRPPIPVRIALDLTPNVRVILAAAGVMVFIGALLGLVTGIQSTSARVVGSLRPPHAGVGLRRQRTRSAFVSAQLAVTVVLLVVAGLFTRTVTRAMSADPGMEPEGLVLTGVDPERAGYSPEEARLVYAEILDRVRARPGIQAAAAFPSPLTGGANTAEAVVRGGPRVSTYYGWFEGAWFATAETRIVAGRTFNAEEEGPGGVPVAVINEALAQRLWPGQSPLGRTFELRSVQRTVVGVAENGRYRDMSEELRSFAFLSWNGGPSPSASIYLRADDGTTATAMSALREELAATDPDLTAPLVTTMTEQIALFLTPQRVAAWITGIFAALGMLLAGVGVFGITAMEVSQRRREIGIRMALGARHQSVAGRVVARALGIAALGLGLGVLGSLALNGLVSRFVFGVSLADPWLLALVPLSLGALTALASWIPARRATRVDPVTVLKDA